jgi:predicted transcriptional regulator
MFDYLENPDIQKNNIKKIRTDLGLTITALSTLAGVSTKVISQTERMLVNPTKVTKNKILIGLNSDSTFTEKKWEYEDVFPGDD